MELKEMQFKEGTSVYTSDGDKVGEIERFVLDPRDQDIIGLVVEKGFLFPEDRVIPITDIESADEDRVELRERVESEHEFPPFEEVDYVTPSQAEVDTYYEQEYREPVYYYPPYGAATVYPGGYPFEQKIVKERNIPKGTVAIKEGANVRTRDDKSIGEVEKVFVDPNTHDLTHFTIKSGFIFKNEKHIPASWIKHVMDSEITLAVDKSTIDKINES